MLLLEGDTLSREETVLLAERINEKWTAYAPEMNILIGVGNNRNSINELSKCAEEAELALKFGHYLKLCTTFVFTPTLGFLTG